jgi:hypothetical protein
MLGNGTEFAKIVCLKEEEEDEEYSPEESLDSAEESSCEEDFDDDDKLDLQEEVDQINLERVALQTREGLLQKTRGLGAF